MGTQPNNETAMFIKPEALGVITGCICLVSVLALVANASVLYAFCKSKNLRRKTSNYFAVNLALSDICIVLGPMSLWLLNIWYNYEYYVFNTGAMMSDQASMYYSAFWHWLDAILMSVSVTNLALLSVERYVALEKPIWYRTRITRKKTRIACLFPWVYSVIVMSPSLAFDDGSMARYIHKAIPTLLSCVVVIISYSLLLRTVLTKRQQESRKRSTKMLKKKREVTLTLRLSLLTVVFLLCWVPVTIFSFLVASGGSFNRLSVKVYLTVAPSLKLLSYLSSFMNPFLYVFGRPAFARFLKRELCCRNRSESDGQMSTMSQASKQRSRSGCNLDLYAEAKV